MSGRGWGGGEELELWHEPQQVMMMDREKGGLLEIPLEGRTMDRVWPSPSPAEPGADLFAPGSFPPPTSSRSSLPPCIAPPPPVGL